MAELSGLKRGRTRARLVAAATAAALLITGAAAGSASADDASPSATSAAKAPAKGAGAFGIQGTSGVTPDNALYGVDSKGVIWGYTQNLEGGLNSRDESGSGWAGTTHMTQVDHDADGMSDGIWAVEGGYLLSLFWDQPATTVGGGWGIYNKVFSASDLAGAGADDLLARDTKGNLYLYLGYGNGKLTGRTLVGGGWQAYNQITGKGDLTGDGKNDIVARDGSGVLWLYKGTGDRAKPFTARTKIGGGWNAFNYLVQVGDIDLDGTTDLIARSTGGALYLYKGTGNAAAPFKAKTLIGSSGWNSYRLMY
ncbi:FG-GAP repeat domain-containing protein [Streptomyces genisteinicus]|uniref:FG-GAP repeat domain-containing protein n=1 Tax=Streptomyces genisteinicus TaxID=2768068 RepID=UPI001FEA8A19|nr:VCBS repeat-containing protein [Streptomyces genisteinicus]